MIAWEHELNGVARDCAPSLARNLGDGPVLAMYVQLGYAVVATDYAGLGTNFRNAFADSPSNALDVIHSVAAARQALPQLSSRWVAVGTDEGGNAVVTVAEMEHQIEGSNYIGGITIARLADLQDKYEPLGSVPYQLPLFLAYGIKTVFPQFQVKEILTDKGLEFYQQIATTCSETEAVPEGSATGMLKSNWQSNPVVKDYFSRNRLGLKPANGPLLVIGSESDPSIAETAKVVGRLCKEGDRVQFQRYRDYDPGAVIGDSVNEQISWIRSRFANRPAPSNCSQEP